MTLSIHEDDEGQFSLELSKNYVAYPNNFWDNGLPVFSPADNQAEFESIGLSLNEAALVAARHFPRIESVKTGYGNHIEELANTTAFGWGWECAVFLAHRGEAISGIWFLLNSPTPEQQASIAKFIDEINTHGPFLLQADAFQVLCSDSAALKKCLASEC